VRKKGGAGAGFFGRITRPALPPGIVAHQSALKDGETLNVPQYVPKTSG
jgi:hypothetical protein